MIVQLGRVQFYDGKTAVSRDCALGFDYNELVLLDWATQNETGRWPASVVRLEFGARGDVIIELDPDRSNVYCTTKDAELGKDIQRKIHLVAGLPKKENKSKTILLSLSAIAAVIACLVFLLPLFARYTAQNIPASWEEKIGANIEDSILQRISDGQTCTTPEGEAALQQLVNSLAIHTDLAFQPQVTVAKSPIPNAFALPGGRILILSKTLEIVSGPNELAAVLAHEIGHIKHRHSLQSFVSAASTGILFSLFIGDVTGGTLIAGLGEAMLDSSYSRDMERQADMFAADLLPKANINPLQLNAFLEKASKYQPNLSGISQAFELLSTHPPTAERTASILEMARQDIQSRSILQQEDWRNLTEICQ